MAEPRLFYQDDCNLSLLEGKTIAIIGYGSQGLAALIKTRSEEHTSWKISVTFIDLLSGYEILELARKGITGLTRGSDDVVMLD